MPNKYPEKKGWDVPKQQYKVTNWPEYNAALCHAVRLMFGYQTKPFHNGMQKIESMMELVHQIFSVILQLSLAMKYVRFISCRFVKPKVLLIRYFD